MSRWKVAQHIQNRYWIAYPAIYDAEEPESNVDDDLPRQPLARGFRKWREAMDYADRMARTRKVVLPRVKGSGAIRLDVQYNDEGDVRAGMYATQGKVYYHAPEAKLDHWARVLLTLAERAKHAGT